MIYDYLRYALHDRGIDLDFLLLAALANAFLLALGLAAVDECAILYAFGEDGSECEHQLIRLRKQHEDGWNGIDIREHGRDHLVHGRVIRRDQFFAEWDQLMQCWLLHLCITVYYTIYYRG